MSRFVNTRLSLSWLRVRPLMAGVHPDRWRAIFAGIPSGDFIAAHWSVAPELRAWDDAVYGGGPDEVPPTAPGQAAAMRAA